MTNDNHSKPERKDREEWEEVRIVDNRRSRQHPDAKLVEPADIIAARPQKPQPVVVRSNVTNAHDRLMEDAIDAIAKKANGGYYEVACCPEALDPNDPQNNGQPVGWRFIISTPSPVMGNWLCCSTAIADPRPGGHVLDLLAQQAMMQLSQMCVAAMKQMGN